ncbi:unnamed protein product [Ectocarpus sp. 4 AP-2014]
MKTPTDPFLFILFSSHSRESVATTRVCRSSCKHLLPQSPPAAAADHTRTETMRRSGGRERKTVRAAFLIVVLLRAAGALVVGKLGSVLLARAADARGRNSVRSSRPTAAPTAAGAQPPPRWGCLRRPTGPASFTQDLRRGSSLLSSTVASWPSVEGTADGNGGPSDKDRAGGAKGGGRGWTLKEQEGPAWTEIVWDESKERFVEADSLRDRSNSQRVRGAVGGLQLLLRHWFIPEDVTPDYYHFTFWRMFQRFVAGTINVFGTQALLLALGIKAKRLGAAAAMSWVLKDALGKFGRILWASKMGRRFDSDAKRWRFRSSLLYAAGNGLEIVTYVFPASFLVLAAMANSFKQMSMLTSSATRNTIYRSFARGENIGDITAKGEAQIAVVDVLGMLSGIGLCTLVGTSRQTIVAAYVILSLVDISAIYNEIRAVCFSVLNHERTHLLVRDFVASGSDPSAMAQTPVVPRSPCSSSALEPLESLLQTVAVGDTAAAAPGLGGSGGAPGGGGGGGPAGDLETEPLLQRRSGREKEGVEVEATGAGAAVAAPPPAESHPAAAAAATAAVDVGNNGQVATAAKAAPLTIEEKEEAGKSLLSSPSTVSRRENIFLASRLTTNAFKTWSQAGVSMDGVTDLLRIFGNERYMLAYTEKKKRGRQAKRIVRAGAGDGDGGGDRAAPRGIVSVILHRDATGADTVKSLLALEYLQDELKQAGFEVVGAPPAARSGGKATPPAAMTRPVNGDGSPAVAEPAAAAVTRGVPPPPPGGAEQGEVASGAPTPTISGGTAPVPSAAGAGGAKSERSQPSSAELRRCLEAARRRAEEGAPGFFAALETLGWSTEKFMFGNIKSRVEWRS